MSVDIQAGSLMLRSGVQGPNTMSLSTSPYSSQWDLVAGRDTCESERAVRSAGWHLMCIAGEVRALAFGHNEWKNVRHAVDRILAQVLAQDFNGAEVVEIATRHFLGVPYLSVRAHARHLQQGDTLHGRAVRRQAQHDLDWARA